MADEPNKRLATEAATAVAASARSLREKLLDNILSVNMACIKMAEGSWEEHWLMSVIMGLLVSLRKAHNESHTTVRWPDP